MDSSRCWFWILEVEASAAHSMALGCVPEVLVALPVGADRAMHYRLRRGSLDVGYSQSWMLQVQGQGMFKYNLGLLCQLPT